MSLPAVTLALLLPALSADLTVTAQASVRPRECAPDGSQGKRQSLWERAREPNLRRYCDLLARGFGLLGVSPKEARALAIEASELAPHYAAPLVLLGRAEIALRVHDGALVAFEKARAMDDRSLEEPGAMQAFAVALFHAGRSEEALATYRALLPRVGLLDGADKRVRVLLEAAELSSARGAPLDEVVAILLRARREPIREAKPRVLTMLALALDRRGESDRAETLLAEVDRAGGPVAVSAFASDALGTKENEAALALAEEAGDPSGALRRWEAYLASLSEASPHREHARRRIERLRNGRRS